MGSRHERVDVHVLRPPRSAAAVLDTEMIVQRKWTIARSSVGTSQLDPLTDSPHVENAASATESFVESLPAKTERLRSILQSWIAGGGADGRDAIVATVDASSSGFVAVISVKKAENSSTSSFGGPQLLVGIADRVSADIDEQIEACGCAGIKEIPTDSADVEHAVRAIESWCSHERASVAAGVGVSSFVRRKQITSRIDSAIQSAPPQLRSARSTIAARARKVATTQQCAAVEQELDSLLRSELPDDEWLQAIAALDPKQPVTHTMNSSTGVLRIHALLIMRARGLQPEHDAGISQWFNHG
jgi:hypothetical protein